ncbi:MAG: transcriptional regulator [bacterium]|nr:transcriptional regulator [bacterium]
MHFWVLSPKLPLELKSPKPKCSRYPKEVLTAGDELRSVRLDRGFTQHQVAKMIGVNRNFIYEMELGKHTNTIYALHKVYLFLGYIPITLKMPLGLRKELFEYRIIYGYSFSALSKKIGLDKSTIVRFEKGKSSKKSTIEKIITFLNNDNLSKFTLDIRMRNIH